MPFTTVDGADLYWEEGGEGEPLLLIQGLGFSAAMWFRVAPLLEARYRVIRYDARGIGRSSVPPGPYTIPVMAADAVAVVDAARADRAHVFGISLGGIVAQEVAIAHPDRLLSLTLCSTHPAGEQAVWPDQSVITMLTTRNESATPEEAIRASAPVAYAPATDAAVIDEDVRRRLELPNTAEGYQNQLMGGLGYEGTLPRLASVSVPTLILHGTLDQMVPPANAQILAGAIPDSRVVMLPETGHVVFSERPEALAREVLGFLDGLERMDRAHV